MAGMNPRKRTTMQACLTALDAKVQTLGHVGLIGTTLKLSVFVDNLNLA